MDGLTLRVLLLGYAGQGNFGDDLLLKQAIDAIEASGNHQITIHSYANDNRSSYLRVCYPRCKLTTGKITYSLISQQDRVLYFGGGIFYDYDKISYVKFIRRMLSEIRLFTLPRVIKGVRLGGVGIGLGPFECEKGLKLAMRRIRAFTLLGVRDLKSLKIAHLQGVTNVKMTPDLSLILADGNQPLCRDYKAYIASPNILICPRQFPKWPIKEQYLVALENAARELRKKFPASKITVFGFQSNQDEEVLTRMQLVADIVDVWDPLRMDINGVLKLFAAQDIVVSSRMHGIFVAGIVGTPSVAIGVDPKLAYATDFFNNSAHVKDTASASEIVDAVVSGLTMVRGRDAVLNLSTLSLECRAEYRRMSAWLTQDTE